MEGPGGSHGHLHKIMDLCMMSWMIGLDAMHMRTRPGQLIALHCTPYYNIVQKILLQ